MSAKNTDPVSVSPGSLGREELATAFVISHQEFLRGLESGVWSRNVLEMRLLELISMPKMEPRSRGLGLGHLLLQLLALSSQVPGEPPPSFNDTSGGKNPQGKAECRVPVQFLLRILFCPLPFCRFLLGCVLSELFEMGTMKKYSILRKKCG